MLSSFRTYQITFQAFHSDMHWYQVVSIVSNKPLFQLYCTFPILLFSWRIFLIVFTFSCMLLLCVVETNALIYTATSKANSYCQYWSRAYNACGIVSNKNNQSERKREKKFWSWFSDRIRPVQSSEPNRKMFCDWFQEINIYSKTTI